jgi:outer membrane immunogenic protein
MSVRRFVLALGVLSVSSLSALAADMPMKALPVIAPPIPVYTWTGCYIGGQVGAGGLARAHWAYSNNNPYDAFGPANPVVATGNDFTMSSWIAGGQVGCNYQFAGNWVVGVEGSWAGTDLSETVNNAIQVFLPSVQTVTTDIKSIATVTGRLGYSFMPQWLVYAKGGYAGGRIETSGATSPPIGGLNLDWSTSEWHSGWTVGAGVEYHAWKYITLGLEYDFIRLNSVDHTGAISGGAITAANQVVHSVDADIHAVTARVNFLFGPGM